MSNDCFGRAFLVTVRHTGALLRTLHAKVEGNDPAMFVSDVHGQQEQASPIRWMGRCCLLGSPQFNYEPFNSNSVNIRSWSWNYRGCWHQTCPPIVTRCWMVLNIPHWKSQTHEAFGTPISFRCLIICFGIGQFARLLPSVEVVAISQAPSPESNPNPPLPSTPWQSTTRPSLADRAVVRQKTLARPAFAKMNWFSTTPYYCTVRCIGLYFHSSAGSATTLSVETYGVLNGTSPLVHVLAWRFAQGIQ